MHMMFRKWLIILVNGLKWIRIFIPIYDLAQVHLHSVRHQLQIFFRHPFIFILRIWVVNLQIDNTPVGLGLQPFFQPIYVGRMVGFGWWLEFSKQRFLTDHHLHLRLPFGESSGKIFVRSFHGLFGIGRFHWLRLHIGEVLVHEVIKIVLVLFLIDF